MTERLLPVALLALSLGACALRSAPGSDGLAALALYNALQDATPAARQQAWDALASAEQDDPLARWRRALLLSLPGHGGHDPVAARAALVYLRDAAGDTQLAGLARLRLHELEVQQRHEAELRALRQRLRAIAEIEREMDHDKRP